MKLASALLFTLTALAQEAPEIRGTVIEYGPNTGIAGATVTLTERVFKEPDIPVRVVGSAVTDAQGRFSFKPGHYGDFYLDASMTGYSARPAETLNSRVMAMNDTPNVVTLTLLRPGSLSGRFVDADGKPIARLPVSAIPANLTGSRPKDTVTDLDGYFVFTEMLPRSYVVRPLPAASTVAVRSSFTAADADIVDEDFESTYWPGGAPSPRSALPVNVVPAGATNVGTIRLRRVPYYRLRVRVQSVCEAGEPWNLMLLDTEIPIPMEQLPALCSEELLVRNVPPGSYLLALFGGTLAQTTKWALTSVFVGSRNITVPLTLAPPTELQGRFSGSAKPKDFLVSMRPLDLIGVGSLPVRPDAQGRFSLPGVVWPRHKLAIESQNPAAFVKEIRYNNQLVTDGIFEFVPGATLAITVDEGAASVTAKVAGAVTRTPAMIFLTKWPRGAHPATIDAAAPFQRLASVRPDGTFQFSSMPPGEYRIVAFPLGGGADLFDALVFNRLILQAETITLERGATKTIDLKLADLSK